MFPQRQALYRKLEEARKSRVLTYVTGDRPGAETVVGSDVYDFFVRHLDALTTTKVERISLVLYTRGGSTLAGWSIVNLLRRFCIELEIIVPSKAHSTGTIMCLGADRILMTKQATLGPIDPSINGPLNPKIPGSNNPSATVPVSVEAITGFLELAKSRGIQNEQHVATVLLKLADYVHPLVLGDVYRSKQQIQMLAKALLVNQVKDEARIKEIVDFLCSESGSHDYTINRHEARTRLGLAVENPNDDLYATIKAIYDDLAQELQLHEKLDIAAIAASGKVPPTLTLVRGLLESLAEGSHAFATDGKIVTQQQGQFAFVNTFEGWRRHAPAA